MRYMVDSTNINDDPTSFALVAYYCDGAFAVSEAAVRARFPHAVLVPISAIGTNNGVVGDCEPGCMTYDGLVTWVVERRAAGVDPTGYVNEMHDWVPARAAFARRGVAQPHWWVADYDGLDVIPAGAVAKQDKNSAMTGGHFDKSVVADYWPGVDGAFGDPAHSVTGGFDLPLTLPVKRSFVHLTYIAALGRHPETQAAEDGWANKIADDGSNLDTVIAAISTSPEGKAHLAKIDAPDEDPTPAAGPAGPAGPQGAAGAPGKDGTSPDPNVITTSVLQRLLDALRRALGL